MQYVILGLLLRGPLSLYDVQKRFASTISLFYSASAGSIQRAMQNLVADGAVTVGEADGSRRGRKLYHLADTGRTRWREWMLSPIPGGADAEKIVLAKVFLLGRLDDRADRVDVLDRIRHSVAEARARSRRSRQTRTRGLPGSARGSALCSYTSAPPSTTACVGTRCSPDGSTR